MGILSLIPGSTRGIILFMILFGIGIAGFTNTSFFDTIESSQNEMVSALNGTAYTPQDMSLNIPLLGEFQIPFISGFLSSIGNLLTMFTGIFTVIGAFMTSFIGAIGTLPAIIIVGITVMLSVSIIVALINLIWGTD